MFNRTHTFEEVEEVYSDIEANSYEYEDAMETKI